MDFLFYYWEFQVFPTIIRYQTEGKERIYLFLLISFKETVSEPNLNISMTFTSFLYNMIPIEKATNTD